MSRKEKKVIQKEKATPQKKPIVVEMPEDFYDKVPSWSFKMMDNRYVKCGLCHANDLYNKVIKNLYFDISRFLVIKSYSTQKSYLIR